MDNKNMISQQEIEKSKGIINNINQYYYSKMVGQYRLGTSLLIAIMCNGHILLESVPGLAKTTAAKTLTESMNGTFSRIQCTPDLLPSDIIGTQIFNYQTNNFETKLGPVYANFVLLDEINRSSAKTQSAMLEVMQEHQTTIGGEVFKMPEIFTVIATQNPIEQEGTYLLSEAQLDRFIIKEKIEYPNQDEELEILNRIENNVFAESHPVVSLEDVKYLQQLVERVYVDPAIKRYIIAIIDATRHPDKFISKELSQYITLGASTRGGIALMEVAKAVALMNGRNYVTPDDVKVLIYSVLRHRITLNFAAVADNITEERIINEIIGAIQTP
ncbi:MAG: MoxR family ATPase [Lachnospiraceae bacterium]|nr:MoxR family ATPase [Lachnospiraceae bacterium]MBR1816248.1 MoxR family ATPase [Lachnospiraceae bacterium]